MPPLPRIPDKTGKLYGELNASHFTQGKFVHAALQVLEEGRTIDSSSMFNTFEAVAFDAFPQLDKYKGIFEETAGLAVHLAGSGPCLFTSIQDEQKASEVCLSMRRRGLECYVAASLSRGE
jgi:4-diphosphocytidyl-2-C-methyl-D-erythritol kinase